MTNHQAPAAFVQDSAVDFATQLNPAQLEAVRSLDGPHLVIAGAGSGKTRTLIYRVAHLVLAGVPPESILLLTFTRRAAQEMLRRASHILDERCGRVAGGTFHSFANLVLRRYAKLLGYDPNFTILDRSDAGDMVAVLRAEGGYTEGGRRFPRKQTLIDMFSRRVNTERSLADIVEDNFPQFTTELDALTELEKVYATRKRQQNVMDYDDLLVNLRKLLVDHERVRRKLAATYRYVMLDEYQDTNRLQAHIAALLASTHGNLMVVGDDAQSIYSFRGAHFKNIMDFPKIFPDCSTILLERNYRSTQPILDLGNAIMENARERFTKELHTDVKGSRRPSFVRTTDEYAQAVFICRNVLELREQGVPLSDIAVLCRAAWHSNTLEIELQNCNIPFRKFGGIKFVEAAHVKDVCALLKVSLNPRDSASWFRILQLCEGIGPKIAQRIGQSLIDSDGDFTTLGQTDLRSKKYGQDLGGLRSVLAALKDRELGVSERLERAIAYYKRLMPKKYDDLDHRIRDLEAVRLLAERYRSLDTFLSDLAIEPPEVGRPAKGRDTEDEWMTVSTVHSAKGLEWHTVFILSLNAGQFPVIDSSHDPEGFEEERRLLYVAVTRAKENLFLLKPERSPGRGPHSFGLAELSPLIWEIGDFEQLVEIEHFAPQEPRHSTESEAVDRDPAGGSEIFDRIQDYFSSD